MPLLLAAAGIHGCSPPIAQQQQQHGWQLRLLCVAVHCSNLAVTQVQGVGWAGAEEKAQRLLAWHTVCTVPLCCARWYLLHGAPQPFPLWGQPLPATAHVPQPQAASGNNTVCLVSVVCPSSCVAGEVCCGAAWWRTQGAACMVGIPAPACCMPPVVLCGLQAHQRWCQPWALAAGPIASLCAAGACV
jgi:hypothetical protein